MGLLLSLVLLISNVPATAVVAETFAPTEAEELVPKNTAERAANSSAYGEGTIYPTLNAAQKNIEQQIRSYAKSLNYSGADGDAAWELAMHGITGRGKHLKLSGNHGLTAALMNSEMGLTTLTRGCIMGISVMQHNGLSSAVNDAGCNYDTKLPIYYTCIYPDDSFNKDRRLYNADACLYTGPLNAYDKSLMWISGSMEIHMYFTRGTVTADNITYNVTVNFEDRFDFNSNSSSVPEEIASLIGSFLFRGFDWTATAKFQVTVPNLCTHQSNSYHWVYDASKQQLTADASNGFDQNSVQKFSYRNLYATDNTYRTFYHINQAIHLRHDRPWVMEYMTSDPDTLILSGSNVQNTVNPYFYYENRMQYLFIPIMKRLSDGTEHTDYYGVPLNREFQYKAGDSYSVRLENVLEKDGSNTIYLTVYNNTTQETVLEPTPMNDRYVKENSSYVLKTADSDGLTGMDFVIDYIGNRYYTFEPTSFDLKIWENGVDGGKGDYFTSKVTKPTCTARGYTTHTCALCGYSYKDTYVATLGHSYGDWVQKTPPTCTAQGEEQRTCKTCKGTETRSIATTGHSYDVVVTPPTCTGEGYTTHTCTACGENFADNRVSATGHRYTLNDNHTCDICKYSKTPGKPVVENKTYYSVTLVQSNGFEYSKDGTVWQSSNVFAGLSADTTYTFYQRVKASATALVSEVSAVLTVRTDEEPVYTIVFKNWDGTVLSTKTYHYGDTIAIPANPTRPDNGTYTYTFTGWDKEVANCAGNAVYTATYTPTYIDYTIVFKNWDGTVLSTKTYHYGDKVTIPADPTKAADNTYTYAFVGWDKAVVNCAGNAMYTATYTSNYINYTVVFKNWDGTVLSTKTYHYGDRVTAPANPTKTSDKTYTYAFTGWDKTVVNCAGDATYTAVYQKNYINYTITFQYADGTVIKQYQLHYGDVVNAPVPDVPANMGQNYVFSDWDKTVTACYANAVYTAVFEMVYIPGDIDGNGEVNRDDVVALLLHVSMPEAFPITIPADYNGDGLVTRDDVIQLLLHVSMPETFPLQ